jgi:hypothetical protein
MQKADQVYFDKLVKKYMADEFTEAQAKYLAYQEMGLDIPNGIKQKVYDEEITLSMTGGFLPLKIKKKIKNNPSRKNNMKKNKNPFSQMLKENPVRVKSNPTEQEHQRILNFVKDNCLYSLRAIDNYKLSRLSLNYFNKIKHAKDDHLISKAILELVHDAEKDRDIRTDFRNVYNALISLISYGSYRIANYLNHEKTNSKINRNASKKINDYFDVSKATLLATKKLSLGKIEYYAVEKSFSNFQMWTLFAVLRFEENKKDKNGNIISDEYAKDITIDSLFIVSREYDQTQISPFVYSFDAPMAILFIHLAKVYNKISFNIKKEKLNKVFELIDGAEVSDKSSHSEVVLNKDRVTALDIVVAEEKKIKISLNPIKAQKTASGDIRVFRTEDDKFVIVKKEKGCYGVYPGGDQFKRIGTPNKQAAIAKAKEILSRRNNPSKKSKKSQSVSFTEIIAGKQFKASRKKNPEREGEAEEGVEDFKRAPDKDKQFIKLFSLYDAALYSIHIGDDQKYLINANKTSDRHNLERLLKLSKSPPVKKFIEYKLNILYSLSDAPSFPSREPLDHGPIRMVNNPNNFHGTIAEIDDDIKKQIIEMYKAGDTIIRISKVVHLNSTLVKQVLSEAGVPVRKGGHKERVKPNPRLRSVKDFYQGIFDNIVDIYKELASAEFGTEFFKHNIRLVMWAQGAILNYPDNAYMTALMIERIYDMRSDIPDMKYQVQRILRMVVVNPTAADLQVQKIKTRSFAHRALAMFDTGAFMDRATYFMFMSKRLQQFSTDFFKLNKQVAVIDFTNFLRFFSINRYQEKHDVLIRELTDLILDKQNLKQADEETKVEIRLRLEDIHTDSMIIIARSRQYVEDFTNNVKDGHDSKDYLNKKYKLGE